MILLIDNYDSFSYNLYQMIGEINPDIKVIRNDELNLSEIKDLNPESIIISPGPGRPSEAGLSMEIIRMFYKDIPILGICLGHQCIYEEFGGEVSYSKRLVHGKTSNIEINNENPIFADLKDQITVGRYHSLSGLESSFPNDFSILAKSKEDDEIMGIVHNVYPVFGLQFHPESILTPEGSIILKNFLNLVKS